MRVLLREYDTQPQPRPVLTYMTDNCQQNKQKVSDTDNHPPQKRSVQLV